MIEYLEQLVEDRKYWEALDLAEQLIKERHSPADLLRIHVAQVVSHCSVAEYDLALSSGEQAIRLAEDLADWDAYGTLVVCVGVAYSRLGQLQEAQSLIYDYLGHLQHYDKAASYEQSAWYNLGVIQLSTNREEAAKSLANALQAAIRRRDDRYAHGVRQALIDAYLKDRVYAPIPRLMAQSRRHIRDAMVNGASLKSWIYFVVARAEFALATGRPLRARLLTSKTLWLALGEPAHEFLLHVVLAKVAVAEGETVQAYDHASAAQTCAMATGRSDMEAEAAELLYQLNEVASGA